MMKRERESMYKYKRERENSFKVWLISQSVVFQALRVLL